MRLISFHSKTLYILCIYNLPPYWQLDLVKNNKNKDKKEVVARDVGFVLLQHEISPQLNVRFWNNFFSSGIFRARAITNLFLKEI